MSKKHILVVGAGSVGKRHLCNFAALGCDVSAMDPRQDRLIEAAGQVSLLKKYTSLEEALNAKAHYDGVVIASPPKFHVEQCIETVRKGLPVLLEKPVCVYYDETRKLMDALSAIPQQKLLLGYTYRWWPPLAEFRNRINASEIGKPLHARFIMSAHLADWHPWEKYQDFFMAKKELGGGALLDESHFLDLMIWFFGMPKNIFAKVEHISSLEIETDDNVDVIAVYDNSLRVTIHLDLYGRPHEKYISVTGEKGTLRWSFEPNCIQQSSKIEHEWDSTSFEYERNDMFVNVAKEFIELLKGRSAISCTLKDGINVLTIIEACRQSSQSGRVVTL